MNENERDRKIFDACISYIESIFDFLSEVSGLIETGCCGEISFDEYASHVVERIFFSEGLANNRNKFEVFEKCELMGISPSKKIVFKLMLEEGDDEA